SGGEDQVVRIWDVAEGKLLQRCKGHEGAIFSLAFTKDGRTLASGSGWSPRTGGKKEANALRLWEVATGKQLAKWGDCGEGIVAIYFSTDERTLISAGEGSIRQWDIATKQEIEQFAGHSSWVGALAFSPNGKQLATGGGDHVIRLWDLATAKEIRRFVGCRGEGDSLGFLPDGTVLFSGSRDGTARLWDVATGKVTGGFKNDDHQVSVAVSRDGSMFASGSWIGNIIVWDTKSKRELRRFSSRKYDSVHSLDFSPDGRWLATGTFNQMDYKEARIGAKVPDDAQSVHIWDMATGRDREGFRHPG